MLRKVRQEFTTPDGARHAVELLAKGQQYVVEGSHPAGGAYAWIGDHPCDGGPDALPTITAADVEMFFGALRGLLERRGCKLGKAPAASATAATGTRKPLTEASLWCPDGAAPVLAILAATPPDRFGTRDELVQFLAPLKASFGPAAGEHWPAVLDWALQFPGAEEDFIAKIWDSISDAALGWDWLSAGFGAHAAAQTDFADPPPSQPDQFNVLESMLSRYVYSTGQSAYYDLTSGEALTSKNFNSRNVAVAQFGRTGIQSAESIFQNEPRARKVATTTYRPGADNLVVEVINGVALTAVNLWRPSIVKPAPGRVTDDDVRPWLDHVSMLFGDEDAPARNHILNYMAFVLQHPGEKINHAVVILSNTQGVGKDTVFVPFLAAIGHHNAWVVMPEDLVGPFNPYVERQLIIVAEMANFNKREMTNKIKPLLASPPFFIQVNKKNVGQYSIPNLGNVIMFTNYDNAISIDEQDRRYWVHKSLTEEARGPDYFKPIYEWYGPKPLYDGKGSMLIARWLLQRDLTGFDPNERPAMTDAKQDMIDGALPAPVKWLATLFEEDGEFRGRKIIAAGELVDAAKHAFNSPATVVKEMHAVSALKRAGYKATQDKYRVADGKVVRLWSLKPLANNAQAILEAYAADLRPARA